MDTGPKLFIKARGKGLAGKMRHIHMKNRKK